jgi:hypothetical protein
MTRDFDRLIDPSGVAVVICILMCMSEPRCYVAAVVEDTRGRERRWEEKGEEEEEMEESWVTTE